jgi:hypothetical protein
MENRTVKGAFELVIGRFRALVVSAEAICGAAGCPVDVMST